MIGRRRELRIFRNLPSFGPGFDSHRTYERAILPSWYWSPSFLPYCFIATRVTNEIEAKISDEVWDRQKRWELKRDVLFEVARKLAAVDEKLVEYVPFPFRIPKIHLKNFVCNVGGQNYTPNYDYGTRTFPISRAGPRLFLTFATPRLPRRMQRTLVYRNLEGLYSWCSFSSLDLRRM